MVVFRPLFSAISIDVYCVKWFCRDNNQSCIFVYPGTACTDRTPASNSTQITSNTMTSRPPLVHTDLLLLSAAHNHTPSVLPEWQHSHSRQVAQYCAAAAHAPSDVRICTRTCSLSFQSSGEIRTSLSRCRVAPSRHRHAEYRCLGRKLYSVPWLSYHAQPLSIPYSPSV